MYLSIENSTYLPKYTYAPSWFFVCHEFELIPLDKKATDLVRGINQGIRFFSFPQFRIIRFRKLIRNKKLSKNKAAVRF